jgi:deoxyadenosine/deoxycytidine kinase
MKKFIAIAGNIGVGKSTLVSLLSTQLGWKPFLEPVVENPYLADFYQDMHKWAFHSQIFFLSTRLRAQRKLLDHPTSAVQDRTVYEDAEIFAYNLYQQGYINDRDYQTYHSLYQAITDFLPPPDLVVYLRASVPTLLNRIKQRGRDYERNISDEYLNQLNKLYEAWISRFNFCPALTVSADELDYVTNPNHLNLIMQKIQDKLTGKDEVTFSSDELSG